MRRRAASDRELERVYRRMAAGVLAAIRIAEQDGNDQLVMLIARSADIIAKARAHRARQRELRGATG